MRGLSRTTVKFTTGAAALGLALCLGSVASSEPRRGPPGSPAPATETSKDRDQLRREITEKMRALRMWKITEELKLDEATAAKLFPLLARFDEQEQTLGGERRQIYRDLRPLVETAAPDNARLLALVDRLTANRARRNQLEVERAEAMKRILTPLQLAKMTMLLPRIDDDFRHRIREAVGRGGDGRGGDGRGEGRADDRRRRP